MIQSPSKLLAEEPAEFVEAALKRRAEVPLGDDFKPNPKSPAFVAVGHGGRILMSRDDGQSWQQVFWGYPGSDHGPWATKAVAYTNGVFVVPIGWGAPTAWLASEDSIRWRHLTYGQTKLKGIKEAGNDLTVMPWTWGIACGKGVFVSGGYIQMAATTDFGKTIRTFSLYEFKNDQQPLKLVTHHVSPIYSGDASGRFFAIGNDRSKENAVFGNLWASDDLGKSWKWLEPTLLNEKYDGYSGMVSNSQRVVIASPTGTLISIDRQRFNILRSTDGGESWQEAYKFQPETEVVHCAQGLRDIAFGYVTSEPISHGNE